MDERVILLIWGVLALGSFLWLWVLIGRLERTLLSIRRGVKTLADLIEKTRGKLE